MKKWLSDNNTLMCSIYSEVKSLIAMKFIITLKGKIYTKFCEISRKFVKLNFRKWKVGVGFWSALILSY